MIFTYFLEPRFLTSLLISITVSVSLKRLQSVACITPYRYTHVTLTHILSRKALCQLITTQILPLIKPTSSALPLPAVVLIRLLATTAMAFVILATTMLVSILCALR